MTAKTEDAAQKLGASSGRKFTSTGLPTRNPFDGKDKALAAAWRRGYMDAAKPRTIGRR